MRVLHAQQVVIHSQHAGASDGSTAAAQQVPANGGHVPIEDALLQLQQHAGPALSTVLEFLMAQNRALAEQNAQLAARAAAQQAIRDYEEKGVSGFHFDREIVQDICSLFVEPFINDHALLHEVRNFDWNADPIDPTDVARLFSLVTKLTKTVRNGIFARRLRDSDTPTAPQDVLPRHAALHNKEQKEKGKILVQLHTNFLASLQVLFHQMAQLARHEAPTKEGFASLDSLPPSSPRALQSSGCRHCRVVHSVDRDLVAALLEFYSKAIMQPRRELFEKATGLPTSVPTNYFLSGSKGRVAMEFAREIDLIDLHASADRFRSS